MRRRDVVTLLGGAAAAWPLAARAQQPAMPVIGFLHSSSSDTSENRLRGFRQGLKDTGFIEGENVAIEYRWAGGQIERLPALAAELVRRQVNVIAAFGGDTPALAAKAATATIPIVFVAGTDPVHSGLVATPNRPDGIVTGISLFAGTVNAKRLELIHELVPQVTSVAVLNNPLVTEAEARSRDLQEAARTLGVRLLFQTVRSERELDAAFTTMAGQKAGALFVDGNPFFVSRRDQLSGSQHAKPCLPFTLNASSRTRAV
jgi:putative ABC transport system substrate-binding protein